MRFLTVTSEYASLYLAMNVSSWDIVGSAKQGHIYGGPTLS